MPIEIRELYIKAVIDTGGNAGNAGGAGIPGGDAAKAAASGADMQSEQLIAICVEKVMEILKDKQER